MMTPSTSLRSPHIFVEVQSVVAQESTKPSSSKGPQPTSCLCVGLSRLPRGSLQSLLPLSSARFAENGSRHASLGALRTAAKATLAGGGGGGGWHMPRPYASWEPPSCMVGVAKTMSGSATPMGGE